MKKLLMVAVAVVIAVGAILPVVLQAGTASACTEGRTPGYYKNHTSAEAWSGYSPDMTFREAFQLDGVAVRHEVPDATLYEILCTGGGKWDALNRHSVAALLNAASDLDFYSEAFVIDKVHDCYMYNEWKYVKGMFEEANELGVADD